MEHLAKIRVDLSPFNVHSPQTIDVSGFDVVVIRDRVWLSLGSLTFKLLKVRPADGLQPTLDQMQALVKQPLWEMTTYLFKTGPGNPNWVLPELKYCVWCGADGAAYTGTAEELNALDGIFLAVFSSQPFEPVWR